MISSTLNRISILVTACCLLFNLSVSGQKIGLVLSGGGAKGAAHIGVIKALEENGIPISYIAGTSMGAIIGGLYASGYSPDEMIRIINSKDFSDWISGNIDDRYIYYFKQNDINASWLNLKFDYDSLVLPSLLPSNIISPVQMDWAFMEMFSGPSAACNYNFDSLMVPFRCVASDIAANKPIVLKKGDLGSSIRASMTFPFFFKPIKIDDKLLFDGGMYNNFPADVIYNDFFPDMIIGSKAASNYGPPQKNNIISQLQTMLMAKTDYNLYCNSSVIIEPVMPSVGLTDFSLVNSFVDSGYVATMKKMKEIRAFAYETVSPDEIAKKRSEFRKKQAPLKLDSVFIKGLNHNQAYYLNRTLIHRLQNANLEDVKPEYFKVLADDKIESIYPQLKYDKKSGYYDLFLEVEKSKNLNVQIGGNISSKPINEAFFGVQYKYLGKQAITLSGNSYIGRFYSSGFIGARMDIPTKLPYYLGLDLCFNQWDYFKTTTYFFEDKNPSYLVKNENHIEAEIGFPFSNKGKVQFGLAAAHLKDDYYQTNIFSRTDTADKSTMDLFTTHFLFEINTLNKKEYANKGLNTIVEFRHIFGTEKYDPGSTSEDKNGTYKKWHNWLLFKISYQNYFQHLGRFTLGYYFESILSTQKFFKNYTASILSAPAFEVIPESRALFLPNFRAHNYFASGFQVITRIFSNLDFRLEGYIFQPFEELVRQTNQTTKYSEPLNARYLQGSSALVLHSPFGPISLSVNYFENAEQPFSVIFNIGYIIFNKRAM